MYFCPKVLVEAVRVLRKACESDLEALRGLAEIVRVPLETVSSVADPGCLSRFPDSDPQHWP